MTFRATSARKAVRQLSLLALAVSASLMFQTSAEALQKVKLLIPVRTIDEAFAPFAIAKYLGYFESEGYDVTLLAVGGSNEVALQVSAGNADLGAASPGEALIGVQSGQLHTKYFYDLYYKNIWSVAVRPDSPIKTMAELKGKKLGVQAMGSAGITFGRAFVQQAGLDPQKDISFLPIGMGAQAITSVQRDMVDAIVYWDAAIAKFTFSGLNLRELPAPAAVKALPDVGLLAREDTLKSDPKMLTGIARAVAKAYDFNMANPAAAVLITWKLYPEAKPHNVSPDEALKEGIAVNQERLAIWNSPQTGDKHGLFIPEDWKHLVDFLVNQKVLPAPVAVDKIITNELIDGANAYDRAAIISAAKAEDLGKLQ
jgi:NitT/TauT family transport system substrate-binding protein